MKTLLLKYWREILIVLLLTVAALSVKTCSSKEGDIKALTQAKDSIFTALTTYKQKNGELTYQVQTQQLTIDQIKDFGNQLGVDNKKLKDQVGNLNNLVSVLEAKVSVSGSVVTKGRDTVIVTVHDHRDTVKTEEKVFNYKTQYLSLYQILNEKSDSLRTYYEYDVDFKMVAYWKGKTIFKQGTLVSDLTFSDPNMKVQKFTSMVIKQPEKKWYETTLFKVGIGVAAGIFIAK